MLIQLQVVNTLNHFRSSTQQKLGPAQEKEITTWANRYHVVMSISLMQTLGKVYVTKLCHHDLHSQVSREHRLSR